VKTSLKSGLSAVIILESAIDRIRPLDQIEVKVAPREELATAKVS